MANVRLKLRIEGFNELRKSQEMTSVLKEYADAVLSGAGEGFEASLYEGAKRNAYTITPSSIEASIKNKRENTLAKALGGARR